MELSFSRGFSVGWLHGCDHKALVPGMSSAKRGVLIGTVHDVRKGRVRIELHRPLKAGDGLAFEGDRAAGEEQGGRVFSLTQAGRPVQEEVSSGLVEMTFHDHAVDLQRLWPGQQVWKSDDPALTRRLRKSYTGDIAGRDLPVQVAVTALVGQPLRIHARSGRIARLHLHQRRTVGRRDQASVHRGDARETTRTTGWYRFRAPAADRSIKASPMVPLSVLGQLRHDMVGKLAAAREAAWATGARSSVRNPCCRRCGRKSSVATAAPAAPQLIVLCRSLNQLQAMLEHDQPVDYVDFRTFANIGPP